MIMYSWPAGKPVAGSEYIFNRERVIEFPLRRVLD